MTEILTESFCERCGTRYTFESARPRIRLKGVKVLSRGLKNFVLSDDTSIDEAMAAARSEADREASAHQLDAFHKTFNFCMSCRQYTCPNCWNEAEARCLSCAPLALPEVPADVHDLRELRQAVLIGEPEPGNGTIEAAEHEHEPWPPLEEQEAETVPEIEVEGAETVMAEAESTADHVPPEELEASPESAASVAEEPPADAGDAAGKAVSQTLGLLRRFRPGQSLDAELDAYEREREDAAPIEAPSLPAATDDLAALHADRRAAASTTETVAIEASEAEPAPIADELAPVEAVEPEAAAAVTAAEPEAAAAVTAAEPEPAPAPAPEQPAAPPIAAAAAADVVEQPTWRITAPDPTGTMPPSTPADKGGPVPVQANAAPPRPSTGEPQWPARPEWPAASATPAGLPFLGRPATPQGGMEALWAASNQELVTAPPAPGKAASGIQPCISCGLSLSATARFCRRCGTLQSR